MVVAGSRKVGPVNQVIHTSFVTVVTPTDRPKSVQTAVLSNFWLRFCVRTFLFDITLESDNFLFLLTV